MLCTFLSFQVLFFVIPSALFLSFRALFFVIPSESEESSMDASLRLRSVQHDKRGVIPNAVRNPVWMLRYAYALFSMTRWCHSKCFFLSFRALFFVIPSEARNPVWMLHFAYALFSMTDDVIPNAVRNPVWMLRYAQHDKSESNHGECSFLSFRARARNPVWMLHCAQHDKMVDASLCFASLSMTVHLAGSRVIIGSIRILFSECAFT